MQVMTLHWTKPLLVTAYISSLIILFWNSWSSSLNWGPMGSCYSLWLTLTTMRVCLSFITVTFQRGDGGLMSNGRYAKKFLFIIIFNQYWGNSVVSSYYCNQRSLVSLRILWGIEWLTRRFNDLSFALFRGIKSRCFISPRCPWRN